MHISCSMLLHVGKKEEAVTSGKKIWIHQGIVKRSESGQAEGIAIAKANGIRFGRRKNELPEEFNLYFEMWKKGEISIRKAAEILEISPAIFYRRCKELDETKRNK